MAAAGRPRRRGCYRRPNPSRHRQDAASDRRDRRDRRDTRDPAGPRGSGFAVAVDSPPGPASPCRDQADRGKDVGHPRLLRLRREFLARRFPSPLGTRRPMPRCSEAGGGRVGCTQLAVFSGSGTCGPYGHIRREACAPGLDCHIDDDEHSRGRNPDYIRCLLDPSIPPHRAAPGRGDCRLAGRPDSPAPVSAASPG